MNLSDINSPSDLLKANEETKSPMELAIEALTEVNYEDTKKVVMWLVSNMKDFHHDTVAKLQEDGEYEQANGWVWDESKLAQALQLIDSVD